MDNNMKNLTMGIGSTDSMSKQKGQKQTKTSKKQDQSQRLLEIVNNLKLYHELSTDRCYCIIEENGVTQTMDIDDGNFESWLYYTYSLKFNSLPSGFQMKPIRKYLSHKAKTKGAKIQSYNRIACIDDQIWIDLMDQKNTVILVNKDGWKKTRNPGIHFKRYPNQATLPDPEKGGDLKDLLKLAPAMTLENQVLVLSWLIVSYFTDTSGAFIWFKGTEGSGKTLFATFLRSLIDPVYGKGYSLPSDHEELAQILDHHCVAFFDNVSHMNKKLSDMFCKAYSEGILSRRKKYTDGEDYIFKPNRNAILTSIQLPPVGSDFLDRSIIIQFNRINDSERRIEQEMIRQFSTMQPKLFGAVLDVLVKVLNSPKAELKQLSRIADFQVRGVAAAEALGFGRDLFLKAIKANEDLRKQSIVEGDDLVRAIDSMMRQNPVWKGNATDLLNDLNHFKGDDGQLPYGANALSRKLGGCVPPLERIGIQLHIKPYRVSGNTKKYTLTRIQGQKQNKPGADFSPQQPVVNTGNSSLNQLLDNMLEKEVGYSVTPPQENQAPLVVENTEDSVVKGINIDQSDQKNPMMNDGMDTTAGSVEETGFQKTVINPDECQKPAISFENEKEDSEGSERSFSFKFDPKPSAGRYQP